MIQATGTITLQDGVTTFVNPLINVHIQHGSKFSPAIGTAQVGKVINNERFSDLSNIGAYLYEGINPSFEDIQNGVLAGLQLDYPKVTFQIV